MDISSYKSGHFNLISYFIGKNIRKIGSVGQFKKILLNLKYFNNIYKNATYKKPKKLQINFNYEFSKCSGPGGQQPNKIVYKIYKSQRFKIFEIFKDFKIFQDFKYF